MNSSRLRSLVFGATGGIGQATAQLLHEQGALLAISGRDQNRLKTLAESTGAWHQSGDAEDWETTDSIVAQAANALGGLDAVAVCIGSLLLKPAHLTKRADFDRLMATNLTTAFGIVRATARVMRANGGAIVLVSSAVARTGMINHEAVAAAKGAIEGLTRSAAATYAGNGVRVNCVAPGLVETPLTAAMVGNELMRKASEASHPLGRLGQPADVARAIVWLLSPEQSWITGQVLGVNGGLGNVLPKPPARR
jgi:3-oxoacyl-[acyl-carrier protein] reductase